MRALILLVAAFALGCGGESEDGSMGSTSPDAGGLAEASCNETTRRAELAGPFTCATEPEFIEVTDQGRPFHIFKYEASHPLADSALAFPCSSTAGTVEDPLYEAPQESTQACSVAGVIPWHSVRWSDANDACEAIGWRLCARAELLSACQGESGNAYPYGAVFQGGKCNVREAYTTGPDMTPTVAPAGQFAECVSEDGIHDLTGNLWEWSSERDDSDGNARFYHAAGWKTIAQRHDDIAQACDVDSRIPGLSARSYLAESVGFRCCRDAQ